MKIAVYGKGGIGKSTVSANLSAALALSGRTVLQIGCDPKHDSTRFLLHGRRLTTALEYMKETRPSDYRLSDILAEGFAGVGCVEAGGPKPGVGCAGRGIISTFELLDSFRLRGRCDVTVYDVLGDVVCGGFAVPIRREYADTILIVTSGEFMALYAANNILRGIRNYDGDQPRVAGLVFNRRSVEDEEDRVRRFAAAVGLPVFADVPRSDAFTVSEGLHMTPMELERRLASAGGDPAAYPAAVSLLQSGELSRVCGVFRDMAAKLSGCRLYTAAPLSDEELEQVILSAGPRESAGSTLSACGIPGPDAPAEGEAAVSPLLGGDDRPRPDASRYISRNLYPGAALQGCAFNGAVSTAIHLTDAAVLAHSPKSCAFIVYQSISSGGRRALYQRGAGLPLPLVPDLSCTEMGEPEIVFGGMDRLRADVETIKRRRPRAVIVISACPAGIIGDDIDQVRDLSEPDLPVIPIRTDGNMTGDFMQGTLAAHQILADALIDRGVSPVPDAVNILGEKGSITNTGLNFDTVRGLLEAIGLRVVCRFLCDTTTEQLKNFLAAPLTLPAYGDYTTRTLGDFLADRFGAEIFGRPFPVGFDDTAEWLRALADHFDARSAPAGAPGPDASGPLPADAAAGSTAGGGPGPRRRLAEEIIRREEEAYRDAIGKLRPRLAGKRLMIVTYNHELDWVLRTSLDAGMEIVKVGTRAYSQDEGFRTRLDVSLPIVEDYDLDDLPADIEKLRPDVLLTTYATKAGEKVPVADTIPMCPDIGFATGTKTAARWARLLQTEQKGGWMQDEGLFRKYYA